MINDSSALLAEEGDGGARQVLRNVGIASRQERAARNKKLIMAARWADCYPAESIDPHQLQIPGGNRPIHPGGEGTPEMAGFAVAEFGAHLGSSGGCTERFIADALDIRHRLPRLWARLCANEIDGWQAQKVAQETRHLSQAQAALVDQALAGMIGRWAWAQVLRTLEGKIIEVDAERIAKLAETKLAETGVWVGQHTEHGTKTVFVRADAPDVIWFDAMVDRLADVLARRGDSRSKDQRRAAAVGILANPLYALRLLAEDTAPSLFDPEDLPDFEREDSGSGQDSGPTPCSGPLPEPKPANRSDSTGAADPAQGPEPVEGPEPEPAMPSDDLPVRFPRIDPDHQLARAAVAAIGQLDPARLRPDATLYVHIAMETLQAGGPRRHPGRGHRPDRLQPGRRLARHLQCHPQTGDRPDHRSHARGCVRGAARHARANVSQAADQCFSVLGVRWPAS